MQPALARQFRPTSSTVRASVRQDGIVCLYDNVRRTNLKSYLRAKYGKTPDQYRKDFGLPADYPMSARPSGRKAPVARVRSNPAA